MVKNYLEDKMAEFSKILRKGRLSYNERFKLLVELGKEAQRRYDRNILMNSQGYNLHKLLGGLQFTPNIYSFTNHYFIDLGNNELNKISKFFEYGTGIYNTKIKNDFIKPVNGQYMKFVGTNQYSGVVIFSKKVKGVRPILMMTKTLKSMEFDRSFLQRKIRLNLGI